MFLIFLSKLKTLDVNAQVLKERTTPNYVNATPWWPTSNFKESSSDRLEELFLEIIPNNRCHRNLANWQKKHLSRKLLWEFPWNFFSDLRTFVIGNDERRRVEAANWLKRFLFPQFSRFTAKSPVLVWHLSDFYKSMIWLSVRTASRLAAQSDAGWFCQK